jgi:hypothetical protein
MPRRKVKKPLEEEEEEEMIVENNPEEEEEEEMITPTVYTPMAKGVTPVARSQEEKGSWLNEDKTNWLDPSRTFTTPLFMSSSQPPPKYQVEKSPTRSTYIERGPQKYDSVRNATYFKKEEETLKPYFNAKPLDDKMTPVMEFAGGKDEDFYLYESHIMMQLYTKASNGYLVIHVTNEDDEVHHINAKQVYMFLIKSVKGTPRKIIMSHQNRGNPVLAWSALTMRYRGMTITKASALLSQWEKIKVEQGESASSFLQRMIYLAHKLDAVDQHLTLQMQILHFKRAMKQFDEYKNFFMLIEASRRQYTSIEDVAVELFQYEEMNELSEDYFKSNVKTTQKSSDEDMPQAFNTQNDKGDERRRSKVTCWWCMKTGHAKWECRQRKAGKPQSEEGRKAELEFLKKKVETMSSSYAVEVDEEDSQDEKAMNTTSRNEQQLSVPAVVDSGAYPSFVPSSDYLKEVQQVRNKNVITATGRKAPVLAKGELKLFGDKIIKDVSVAPDVSKPLLSLNQICTQLKCTAIMDEDSCTFIEGKMILSEQQIMAKGNVRNGLYWIDVSTIDNTDAPNYGNDVKNDESPETALHDEEIHLPQIVTESTKKPYKAEVSFNPHLESAYDIWHKRFGHQGNMVDTLKAVPGTGVPNVKWTDEETSKGCETCISAKQKRHSFKTTSRVHKFYERGQAYHLDMEYKPVTKTGYKYDLSMVDDCTKCDIGTALKKKSDAADFIIHQIKTYERITGNHVLALYVDKAKEFVQGRLSDYCYEEGIDIVPSTEYTPEQNAVAESTNKRRTQIASTLLKDGNMQPDQYWPEASRHARLLMSVTKAPNADTIGLTELTGRIFDYSSLKVWGSLAYSHVPKVKRKKLQSKTRKALYLGISPSGRAYRLLDPTNGEIFHSATVIFDETRTGLSAASNSSDTQQDPWEDLIDDDDVITYDEPQIEHEVEQTPEPRRSTRQSKGVGKDDKDFVYNANETFIPNEINTLQLIGSEVNMTSQEAPKSYIKAISGSEAQDWLESMEREIKAHEINGTWILVPRPTDAHVMRGIWNFRKKYERGKLTCLKSRFCADGSKLKCTKEEVHAPIIRPDSMRILLSTAAHCKRIIKSGDIPAAYLKATIPESTKMYVEQPRGFISKEHPDYVCLLKQAIYGAPPSGHIWNKECDGTLKSFGLKQSSVDPALYYMKSEEGRFLYVGLATDDMAIVGSDDSIENDFIGYMKEKYKMKGGEEMKWFLGMRVDQNEDGITLSQVDYLKEILDEMQNIRIFKEDTPYSLKDSREDIEDVMKSIKIDHMLGKLRYLTYTRPDIEYALNETCRMPRENAKQIVNNIVTILGYLTKNPNKGLKFKGGGSKLKSTITAYADSSFATATMRRSPYGYVVMMNGTPISWRAKIPNLVAKSTTEAEFIAISECISEVVFILNLLNEIGIQLMQPPTILVDSQTAKILLETNACTDGSKHIQVKYFFSRQFVQNGTVRVTYIPSNENTADLLTKRLLRILFTKHAMNLVSDILMSLKDEKEEETQDLNFITSIEDRDFAQEWEDAVFQEVLNLESARQFDVTYYGGIEEDEWEESYGG